MTLRILHIIDSLERQGAAGQLCLLAAGLPRDAFECRVISLASEGPHAETLNRAGVPVVSLGRRWPLDPYALARLCRAISMFRPDVVHAWTPDARNYAALAARCCRVPALVLAWRSVDRQTPAWRQRMVARQASAVVVNSAALRHACEMFGMAPDKIRCIPSAVAVAGPPLLSRRQILDRLGLDDTVHLIAAAGPLVRDRCWKDLIWAADLLKVIRDDAHLLIFGAGPQRERLELFRDQVEIADKVHFLGEVCDLGDWLPHVDLFWSARKAAGTPSAVLEAMAAARPVVACDAPAMRELVANERTGYLVRPGHRAGLAQWADHLLSHPDHARQLGEQGRQRALRDFSVEKMVEGYADCYRSC